MINKNSKLFFLVLLGCFVSTGAFGQTVTLLTQSENFADAQGNVVPSGTLFGILVDTSGDGFFTNEYGPFSGGLNGNEYPDSSIALSDGTPTSNALVFVGTTGSNGYIGGAMDVRHSNGSGIAGTGDQWGIIWFPGITNGQTPSSGDSYGFFTHDSLTIPPAGETAFYGDFIPQDIKTADYTIVPEPSVYAAAIGLGILIFVFVVRRRGNH